MGWGGVSKFLVSFFYGGCFWDKMTGLLRVFPFLSSVRTILGGQCSIRWTCVIVEKLCAGLFKVLFGSSLDLFGLRQLRGGEYVFW